MKIARIWHALILAVAFGGSTPALAQAIQNGPISSQTAAFDNTITTNGGTVTLDTLLGLSAGSSWMRTGYTITSTNGDAHPIDTAYIPVGTNSAGAATGGEAIGINPVAPTQLSGLTFTFDDPINAFGLEVGDWATCCFPSSLYISFDGGATRLVATATGANDNPGIPAGEGFLNFVGAIDSSGTFSTINFYGDGIGEYLVAGGTIRYGLVDIGSVPDPGSVPEPATWAMLLMGFGLVGGSMRSARRQHTFAGSCA